MKSDFPDLRSMADRICSFMRRSIKGEVRDEFGPLALELYKIQLAANGAYANFCDARNRRNASPRLSVERWEDVPAAPTVAFKELELTSVAPERRMTVFYSSGTTQQDRSRHFHSTESLELYEESLWLWFEHNFCERLQDIRCVFLTPDRKAAPNSSLAHMFSVIAARQNHTDPLFGGFVDNEGVWQLNLPKLLEALKAAAKGTPVALFGTAFLFVHLLDEMERTGQTIQLPAGSWALETGGYKGRTREVPKSELHRMISKRLGIMRQDIFGEYGMSELSSQAYAGSDGFFRFPPWAQARVISPTTGREAREGERGLIRVYDLANVWSVMAVQTEDIGIKVGDAIQLAGRAAQAEARGCSLMAA